jgi:hypothetical protein
MTPRILLTLLVASALMASACKSTSSPPKDEGKQIPETSGSAPAESARDTVSKSYAREGLARLPEEKAVGALALVATSEGIARVDLNGDGRGELVYEGGDVSHCIMDHRTGVLWFARAEEGAGVADWYGIDMKEGKGAPVELARKLTNGVAIELEFPDKARFGTHGSLDGNASPMLSLGEAPAIALFLGCDGDAGWSCYEDEDFSVLTEELREAKASIEAASLLNVDWLKEISARYRVPEVEKIASTEGPKLGVVPEDRCLESPEDCGTSTAIHGTPYLRVITSNDRGDYYHETQQLYDSEAGEFFDPVRDGARSKAVFSDEDYESPTSGLLSPGGEAYAAGGMMISFKRGTIAEFEHICGWTEPSASFKSRWY